MMKTHGLYLQILGIIGIAFSLIIGFFESAYLYQEELSPAYEVIVDAIIGLRTFIGVFLGLILVGLGSIVKSLNKK